MMDAADLLAQLHATTAADQAWVLAEALREGGVVTTNDRAGRSGGQSPLPTRSRGRGCWNDAIVRLAAAERRALAEQADAWDKGWQTRDDQGQWPNPYRARLDELEEGECL